VTINAHLNAQRQPKVERVFDGAQYGGHMKTHLNCPCGVFVEGKDEDDLVEKTQAHLADKHPGREYDREMILFMAY
jgi:hypothetical protein